MAYVLLIFYNSEYRDAFTLLCVWGLAQAIFVNYTVFHPARRTFSFSSLLRRSKGGICIGS